MIDTLLELRKHYTIGYVGGSDFSKQLEQLNKHLPLFEWWFSENGLCSYRNGEEFHRANLSEQLGQDKLNKLVNYILGYLSMIELPIKRGTFIEYRSGMLNVSPIGRNCSRKEREDFEKYD